MWRLCGQLENVLLDERGHCKISDLGLAVVSKVKIKGYAGTPGYTGQLAHAVNQALERRRVDCARLLTPTPRAVCCQRLR